MEKQMTKFQVALMLILIITGMCVWFANALGTLSIFQYFLFIGVLFILNMLLQSRINT